MQCETIHWQAGDAEDPILIELIRNGSVADLAGKVVLIDLLTEEGESVITDSDEGVEIEPTLSATIASGIIQCVNHGLRAGQQIVIEADTLPTPLVSGQRVFVRDVTPNTFRVSATPAGTALSLTGGSTPTIVLAGCVSWLPPEDLESGRYRLLLNAGADASHLATYGLPEGLLLIVK